MERNLDSEAAIICNDLSSLVTRIEMLQPSPHYTNAALLVMQAYNQVSDGRKCIHQAGMQERYGDKVTLIGGPQAQAVETFVKNGG